MENMDLVSQILSLLGGESALLIKLFVVMGALRVCFKPLMVFVEAVVGQTPTKSDDEWLAKVKISKSYKILSFVLDYVASVKLPQEKKE